MMSDPKKVRVFIKFESAEKWKKPRTIHPDPQSNRRFGWPLQIPGHPNMVDAIFLLTSPIGPGVEVELEILPLSLEGQMILKPGVTFGVWELGIFATGRVLLSG